MNEYKNDLLNLWVEERKREFAPDKVELCVECGGEWDGWAEFDDGSGNLCKKCCDADENS